MERHPTAQKILDEAIRVIDAGGEASLRIQQLEAAVDVSAPSIYHFFGSREGLVAEAQAERLVRSIDEFNATILTQLGTANSKQQLRRVMDALLAMVFDPSRVPVRERRLFILGSAEGRPELATRMGEVARESLRGLAEGLRPYQEKGWIIPDLDLEAFSQWLAGVILGRAYVELGAEPAPHPALDAISVRAVAHIVFGSEE